MHRKHKNENGFTMIDTIITVVISVVVTVLVVGTAMAGLSGIYKSRELERLHANAVVVGDVFSYWIKQGSALAVPDPETLIITLPDATEKTVTLLDGKLTVDGAPVTTSDVVVSSVHFEGLARSVRISFTIAVPGGESFSAETAVALRN